MKKILCFILIILLLTACNETTKTDNEIDDNILDEITLDTENANLLCTQYNKDNKDYKYAGKYAVYIDDNNIVTMINSSELIKSEDLELLDRFESYYNSNYEKIANYGGYIYDIFQENDKLMANVIIDYNTLNLESYVMEYGDILPYLNENYKLTKDKLIEYYKEKGIKCEKK